MTIAIGNTASGQFIGVSSTRTLSMVVGSGHTRLQACMWASGGSGFTADFNGDALTAVGSSPTAGGYTLYVFEMINPDVGTFDITFNWSGSINGAMASVSHSGDNTALGLTSTTNNTTASGASLTVSHTSLTGWAVLFVGTKHASASTLSASTNSTLRVVSAENGDFARVGIFDSNAQVAGAYAMSVTTASSSASAGMEVSLPIENSISVSDTNVTVDSYNSGISLLTITDTNATTDSLTFADWQNQGKSSAPLWSNQSKS
jgi:hypothetical protein